MFLSAQDPDVEQYGKVIIVMLPTHKYTYLNIQSSPREFFQFENTSAYPVK